MKQNNLEKKEWVSTFNLVGECYISDYTFKIDQKSEKSDWIYNLINLSVDCGEKYGRVNCELMGGYGAERDNVIYALSKDKDSGSITVDWDDRFDEDIIKEVSDFSLYSAGLEKTKEDKTFTQKFLSSYDFIKYIKEYLVSGTPVNIRGNLRFRIYEGNVQVVKEIKSIYISSLTPDKYRATFTQTMLLDKYSCTKDSLNKDESVLEVGAYVLEKFREYNGHDLTDNGKIKGGQFVPMKKTFEFPINMEADDWKDKVSKYINKLFKVKKGVTQITFNGYFVETGAAVVPKYDDLPQDIKDLIDIGIFTEEEALEKCADNGNKRKRMFIVQPNIRMVGEEGDKTPQVQKIENKFTEDDLILECLQEKAPEEDEDDEDIEEEIEEVEIDEEDLPFDMDDENWIDNI